MSSNPARAFPGVRGVLQAHWPFALLSAVALFFFLAYLGTDHLWGDEGDTAVLASNVLKFGVPQAWDGVTFTDSDKGARVNDALIMVSHPWLQYYLTAASFFLFGENTFAARLPFALAAWLTLLVVYRLVRRVTGEAAPAWCAVILLTCSLPFILYARQCRYYALSMLLTCWLFSIFLEMKTAKRAALFACAAILLFHAFPVGIVPVAVLGILTLVYRPFAPQRKWFWFAAPVILSGTLPWLLLARSGYAENTASVQTLSQFAARLTQFAIETTSVTPLLGCIALLLFCLLRSLPFTGAERDLLVVTGATIPSYAFAMVATQSAHALWYLGIRYTPALLPMIVIVAGILLVKAANGKTLTWIPLLLVFAFTKIGLLTPWLCLSRETDPPDEKRLVAPHVPMKVVDCFFGGGLPTFIRDLGQANPGTVALAAAFLQTHAQPGEIVITNYDWDALYFHTRLPQGLKILPTYPIVGAARRHHLPEYVFGVEQVRWVLWRPAWDGYLGYNGRDVESDIAARGATVEQVAEIKETVWENRENIHFRRFSGDRYLFPWPSDLPAAHIFRVRRPNEK